MQVRFRTRKLENAYKDYRNAEKAYGRQVARRYIQRVNIIWKMRDIENLKQQRSLRCHKLKGNLQGQWAVKLTGRYRLIFALKGEQLEIARIEEISKHYDD